MESVQVKPDDHSEVVPLLPIPNRTVKRLCADDSADSRVKVGHCQAISKGKGPVVDWALFAFTGSFSCGGRSVARLKKSNCVVHRLQERGFTRSDNAH